MNDQEIYEDMEAIYDYRHTLARHWQTFMEWRQEVSEIIVLPRAFVDIAGDVVSAVLLSQIVYWFMPGKSGKTRVSIVKHDVLWLAKTQKEWFKECGITSAELAKARKVLEGKGLIETMTARWNGSPTVHFHLEFKAFLDAWDQALIGTLERAPRRFARPDVSERNRTNPPRQKQECIPAAQVQPINTEKEHFIQENPITLKTKIVLPKTRKSLTETTAVTLSKILTESDGASALPVRSERASPISEIRSPTLDRAETEQPSALETEADIPKPNPRLDHVFQEGLAQARRQRLKTESSRTAKAARRGS